MVKDRIIRFKEIKNALHNSNIFKKNSLFLKNIKLNVAELSGFDILINLKKEIDLTEQSYIINHAILPDHYLMESSEILENLKKLYDKK
jgi:hypothetical protein